MAYDASFLTGSHERPVDPISTGYLHNDQEISELENGHTILVMDGDKLNLAIESFDQMNDFAVELHRGVRKGSPLTNSMYRILNSEMKNAAKNTQAAFDSLPAMESLNHMGPRELTIAMENAVTDFIKDMWTKLKNMFLSVHKKIKDWYIKAWDGASRLLKQAEALKAKAEGMVSSTARETSFEMSGAKFLNIGGKVPAPQAIGQGVSVITRITQAVCDKNAESYDKIYPELEAFLKSSVEQAKKMKDSNLEKDADGKTKPTTEAEAFGYSKTVQDAAGNQINTNDESNVLLNKIKDIFDKAAEAAGVNPREGTNLKGDTRFPDTNMFVTRSKETLLGDIMVVYSRPNTNVTTTDSYAAWKTAFKISPEPVQAQPKEIEDTASFQTATPDLVSNICENVITACNVFVNYKLLWDKREKSTENLTKQMDQYVAANANLAGVGQKHISNTISATVGLVKKMQDGESRWSKYAMSVLNKAIVYCRTSLNQY